MKGSLVGLKEYCSILSGGDVKAVRNKGLVSRFLTMLFMYAGHPDTLWMYLSWAGSYTVECNLQSCSGAHRQR